VDTLSSDCSTGTVESNSSSNHSTDSSGISRKSFKRKQNEKVIVLDPSLRGADRLQIVNGDDIDDSINYNEIEIPKRASSIDIRERDLVLEEDVEKLSDPDGQYSHIELAPLLRKALQMDGWRLISLGISIYALLGYQYIGHLYVIPVRTNSIE